MKLVRIKHKGVNITEPIKCSFCKQPRKTLHRIQGYPHYGAACCHDCYKIEKALDGAACCHDCYKIEKALDGERAAREAQHDQTDAEWMLGI